MHPELILVIQVIVIASIYCTRNRPVNGAAADLKQFEQIVCNPSRLKAVKAQCIAQWSISQFLVCSTGQNLCNAAPIT
jgi:hypothetical protein